MEIGVWGAERRYGTQWVLRDFSLGLPVTGTVALLGPSGCGKTTLLRVLAGLEPCGRGRVALPEGRLSMVFQEDRLLPGLTAKGNLMAVLGAGGEAEAAYCLEQCGLAGAADMLPGELSGGMRRRVAIARGVAFGGSTLLLDEPLKGLDADLKRQVARFLFRDDGAREIHRPRLNLLVTHDIAEAAACAQRVVITGGPPLEVAQVVDLAGVAGAERLALCRERWEAAQERR